MGEPSTDRTPIQGTPLAPLLMADTGEFDRELDAALERLEAAADEEPSLLDSQEVFPVFADGASRHHSEAISGRMYLLAQEELEEAARRTQAVTPSGQFPVVAASPPTPAVEQEQIANLPWELRQHVVAPVESERGFLRGAIVGAVIALLGCVATASFLAVWYAPQARTFLSNAVTPAPVTETAPAPATGPAPSAAATNAGSAKATAAGPAAAAPARPNGTAGAAPAADASPRSTPKAPPAPAPKSAPAKTEVPVAAPAQMGRTRSTGVGAKAIVKQDVADPELAPGEDAELTEDEIVEVVAAEAVEVAPVVEEPLTDAERAILDGEKMNDAFDQEFGEAESGAGQSAGEEKKTVFIPPPLPQVPENLGQADVLEVVLGRKDEIVGCVKANEASIVADAPRTMTMQWTVHPDGTTSAITVESDVYKGTPLGGCLAERIAQWTFPKHQVQQAPIRFPFAF